MRAPHPGRDYPRTQREFYRDLDTPVACAAWLDRLRWEAGFLCPACGCPDSWTIAGGRRCRGCRRRIAVLSGTPFHRARLPLPTLLEAAWLLTEPGQVLNSAIFRRHAPMNHENAWTVLHKYREVMHAQMLGLELHGVVEADEVFIGGRPRRPGTSKRGRGTTQETVLVLIERRRGGRVLFKRVPTASAATLLPPMRAHVRCPSSIRTDANSSYGGLRALGYRHTAYNMSALPRPAHYYLPAVHAVAANAKRWMLDALRRTPKDKHLDYYLAEFAFRFNQRTARHRGILFYRLMEATLAYGEVTQRAIVGR